MFGGRLKSGCTGLANHPYNFVSLDGFKFQKEFDAEKEIFWKHSGTKRKCW